MIDVDNYARLVVLLRNSYILRQFPPPIRLIRLMFAFLRSVIL